MPAKKPSVQAYVTPSTKVKIVKLASDQDRSESYIAGKILDAAVGKEKEEEK